MPLKSLNGPSSVKSEYHCATLLGNWVEERHTFGAPPFAASSSSFAPASRGEVLPSGETTHRASYQPVSAAEAARARSLGCFCSETPRELLFLHGDVTAPEVHLCSIAERSYGDPRAREGLSQAELLDRPGISTRTTRTKALRRVMGLSGGNLAASGDLTEPDASEPSRMLHERTYIKTLLDATGHTQEGIPRDEGNPSEEPMMDSVFAKDETAYAPPRLLPFGRVMERERLLTTKQVTIDATGEYLKNHLPSYPLTSSNCVKEFMAWTNNPMWKTRLREEE